MLFDEFINSNKDEIILMSNITGISFDESAKAMFSTYNSFGSLEAKDVEGIINKLNEVY